MLGPKMLMLKKQKTKKASQCIAIIYYLQKMSLLKWMAHDKQKALFSLLSLKVNKFHQLRKLKDNKENIINKRNLIMIIIIITIITKAIVNLFNLVLWHWQIWK